DEVRAVLPEVFEAMANETDDKQPRGRGDRGGGDDHEGEGHTDLDRDDPYTSIPDSEADVDRRYHRQTERVDDRAVQPPEHQRRGSLDDTDADAREHRRPIPSGHRGSRRGDDHPAHRGSTLRSRHVDRNSAITARPYPRQ